MHTLTIELLRFGGSAGLLDPLNNYLVLAGNARPPAARSVDLEHSELLRYLYELRYPSDSDKGFLDKALSSLTREADTLLRIPDDVQTPLQIDLVTSAAELWAFPFEMLLRHERFRDLRKNVVVTRRIRRKFVDESTDWPAQPRVLFVHASPDYVHAPPVPAHQHLAALREALKPWIEPLRIAGFPSAVPDESGVLTVLKEASLENVRQAIHEARDEGKPYSHIHILAHGILVQGQYGSYEDQYGLALTSGEQKAARPSELAEILKPIDHRPVCVTLTVCDGGNQSNTIVPGSLAQALHLKGVPIVVASQFPMTMPGSTILTREFYRYLLDGNDVRSALCTAREALKDASDSGALHDWLSLVSYVQLPEGYVDYLEEYSLKRQFSSLKTAQKWADHINENEIDDENALMRVEETLNTRIATLQSSLGTDVVTHARGIYEEMTGLLGSAHKRRAELEEYISKVKPAEKAEWQKRSRKSLKEAHRYYKLGHDANLSAHWNGIQQLSLEAVLNGEIKRSKYLDSVEMASRIALDNGDTWAIGTLLELYLLQQIDGRDPDDIDLDQLLKEAREKGNDYMFESTLRQLNRYIEWWTKDNGYFEGRDTDISHLASNLVKRARAAWLET